MTYRLRLFVSDDSSPAQREAAERLFRQALESSLGDAALVLPVHAAWQRLAARHGESPDMEALTVEERMVFETWQLAEAAALQAVFGPHRHLDEGGYEISAID
ncbi:MAG: hypothetical protein Q8K24_11190 [Hydrogenophaga sp.]|nr:hypothetical protein [Hydrogenophaga sp.]